MINWTCHKCKMMNKTWKRLKQLCWVSFLHSLCLQLPQFTLLPLEPIVNIKHVSYLKLLGVTFQDIFSPTEPTGMCIYAI